MYGNNHPKFVKDMMIYQKYQNCCKKFSKEVNNNKFPNKNIDMTNSSINRTY